MFDKEPVSLASRMNGIVGGDRCLGVTPRAKSAAVICFYVEDD